MAMIAKTPITIGTMITHAAMSSSSLVGGAITGMPTIVTWTHT